MADPDRRRIYLDHNATTPLRDEVVEAMSSVLRNGFGNPSSSHAEGAASHAAVAAARERVAGCLGASPREIFFTAGATEANNTVLQGLMPAEAGDVEIVTTATEHPSVIAPLERLEAAGQRVVRLGVDREGMLDLDELEAALTERTRLVSVIWANNETGVIQPIAQIADRVRARGILLHVDATQAIGKAVVDVAAVPVDLLSSSAHKLNGPRGSAV
jgi:cysteine desulfurase